MNRIPENTYAGYFDYAVRICPETRHFGCLYGHRKVIARDISVSVEDAHGTRLFGIEDFRQAGYEWEQPRYGSWVRLILRLRQGPETAPEEVRLVCSVSREGIFCQMEGLPEGMVPVFRGDLNWGRLEDCFAVSLDRKGGGGHLRSALGPAASAADDTLFDRKTDEALRISGSKKTCLGFSWERNAYTFETRGGFSAAVLRHVYESRFGVLYRPINKRNTFPKPPAGWMTWYAVQFDACEETVLENARRQKEYLQDYGADTIWVDWEWYHSGNPNLHPPESVSFFSPDPVRYPHGLGYVAEEIRRLGFVPALWVGPTSEPAMTALCREFEDAICAERQVWCGQYFFDITDERIVEELIPRAFQKVREWGYSALKWDCLPLTLEMADRFHGLLKHPEISTEEAFRTICQVARETVGTDFYMLSCSGENDRPVLTAAHIFDAARIGGDVFRWKEFLSETVGRVLRLYPYHNVMLYCDPDNVVLRPEFNDFEQAKSRISFISLLGLPVTIGDDLTKLPMDRMELLRRALPTMDIHPMDIRETEPNGKFALINLFISKPYESWNVVDVLNLQEGEGEFSLSLEQDLLLDAGRYLVFDYWNRALLGVFDKDFTVSLGKGASGVYAVRRLAGRPQLVSTTRHITQGAADVEWVRWDPAGFILEGKSQVVQGDDSRVFLYVPEGYRPKDGICSGRLLELVLDTSRTGPVVWRAEFLKENP